jgi:hypothetical protein
MISPIINRTEQKMYLKELSEIEHYQKYPNLIPWVGNGYPDSANKLLILGESHYLEKDSKYHHDPVTWYEGINVSQHKDITWMNTAGIIRNGLQSNWKEKSKLIYKNLSMALFESGINEFKTNDPFNKICYLNYFQRPAEKLGKSIKVSESDSRNSAIVVRDVVSIVKPKIVIFSSTLAWNCARDMGVIEFLQENGIKTARVPHAGMPWWNRISKKYGNTTGKNLFIDFIKKSALS